MNCESLAAQPARPSVPRYPFDEDDPDFARRKQENERMESFAGIRTIRPLLTSSQMKERLEGRKLLKISQIKANIDWRLKDIAGDWVTIAVIVQKLPPKTAKNGKLFSIVKV